MFPFFLPALTLWVNRQIILILLEAFLLPLYLSPLLPLDLPFLLLHFLDFRHLLLLLLLLTSFIIKIILLFLLWLFLNWLNIAILVDLVFGFLLKVCIELVSFFIISRICVNNWNSLYLWLLLIRFLILYFSNSILKKLRVLEEKPFIPFALIDVSDSLGL